MVPSRTEALSGWGRHPVESCNVYRPEKRSEVARVLASGGDRDYLPRGLGRSYGDAALNAGGGVVSQLRLDRLLAFDEATGVLECEGGASLAEIVRVLLPRGWFLPVTPGTRFVTVGGAVASDVHGKNHHRDGTFSAFVESFELLLPSGEAVTCSRGENAELFHATAGGMGLTGSVLRARVRMRRVESAWVSVEHRRTGGLDETLDAFAGDDRHRYSVAWVDTLAGGRAAGRGVLMEGDHAAPDELPRSVRDPLSLPRRATRRLPFDFPGGALNGLTVGAFNRLYHATRRPGRRLADLESYFYPLDAVLEWNRMYGPRGFAQLQVVIPPDGARRGLADLLRRLREAGLPSFLAVLKRFGEAGPGLLSFPVPGYTLALDLPWRPALPAVLAEAHRRVADLGGRVYLAKDSTLDREVFERMYPAAERFRELRRRIDPEGRLGSSLARRVGLAER